MLETIQHLAERTATNVSRRNFLGVLGRGAAASAMFAAVVLTTGSDVHAAAVCGADSTPICRGRDVGSRCRKGRTTYGTCLGYPGCMCL